MTNQELKICIKNVIKHIPNHWITLTTHRLDIYNEAKAKTEFLHHFEKVISEQNFTETTLANLPTAYDYIRLGHPLSSVLEWAIATSYNIDAEQVISFASKTMGILAVLRKNQQEHIPSRIITGNSFPFSQVEINTLKEVYEYDFEVVQPNEVEKSATFHGSTIYLNETKAIHQFDVENKADYHINIHPLLGSVILITDQQRNAIAKIQHVRRRESIAMTPSDALSALKTLSENNMHKESNQRESNRRKVQNEIQKITGSPVNAVIGSSGLSVQYAIMMGCIDYAKKQYPEKPIAFLVPPNCYGGTNDQARRVAASVASVRIVDLPVDSGNDMVESVDRVLETVAKEDAIPFIIAEIPTNPRVEVPNMDGLAKALVKTRYTQKNEQAIAPVFILDQTFCPNTSFLRDQDWLHKISTISYVSGSKFPSGGKCTAGYCVSNTKGRHFMPWIEKHIQICDNQATDLQLEILAEQLPSMLIRIDKAYENTRSFVSFIQKVLPEAKINFVSEALAKQGFTPSVFSLDLPTKGNTPEEREAYKRERNVDLIYRMIEEIPTQSKYCVSYGQLKGCYWTIPATSTQGTTKESDKDYIARVAVSPDLDLEKHKAVFAEFAKTL